MPRTKNVPRTAAQTGGPQVKVRKLVSSHRRFDEEDSMINRHALKFSILAAAIFALGLPVIAAAQGRYGYPDYRRNRDDGQYGRNGQYGRYDTRSLRDSIH